MAENSQINNGPGDQIRAIDRTANAVPIPAKTQVVQLDVGGENAEALVTQAVPMPVSIVGSTLIDGASMLEMFSAILVELRILNRQFYEFTYARRNNEPLSDDPEMLRADFNAAPPQIN